MVKYSTAVIQECAVEQQPSISVPPNTHTRTHTYKLNAHMHTAVTGDLPWGVFSTMLHSIIQSKKGPYGQKHKTTLGAEQVCLLPSAVHCRDSLPPGHYIIFHWDQTAVCFVRVDFRTNFTHAGTIPTAPTVQQNTVQRLTLLGSSLWANWMESASFIDLWLVYL